jgi:hypothetical protein
LNWGISLVGEELAKFTGTNNTSKYVKGRPTLQINLNLFVFSFRGNWHGQVAVKLIEINEPTAIQLQAFKMQVGFSEALFKEPGVFMH